MNPQLIAALRSMVGGAATGASVTTFGVLSFRALQPLGVGDNAQLAYVGLWLLAGIGAAGFWSWRLAHDIAKAWWRGVTTTLAVLGGLMLSGAALPLDYLFPPAYLIGYLIVLVALAVAIARYARMTGNAKADAGRGA